MQFEYGRMCLDMVRTAPTKERGSGAMEQELSLRDYVMVLRLRWPYFVLPMILVLGVTAAIAVLLPPVYQSTGTILVESQQIPSNLVPSTITTYAGERIEIIRQRVMTRENLVKLAERYNLFQEDGPLVGTELVRKMRERVLVELITAEANSGRRGTAAIAFQVSFKHPRRDVALKVANDLVTLFLEENARTRTERATETTGFFAKEAEKLRRDLNAMEDRIAGYKQQHSDALPEHLNLRIAMLERAESELKAIEREIKALQSERRYLELELASEHGGAGGSESDAFSTIRSLEERLAELRVTYNDAHPDVQSVMNQIRALNNDEHDSVADIDVTADVRASRVRREGDLGGRSTTGEPAGGGAVSGSPVLARLQAQFASADSQLESLQEQRGKLKDRIEELQRQIIHTPQVERGLAALERDHEGALRKYNELRAKQMEAQVSESLEEDRKAERFSLLEPPLLPEYPVEPNRKKIMALGLFLAFMGGGGGLMVVESLDGRIRGAARLTSMMRHPPLAVIPYIWTEAETRTKRLRMTLAAGALLLLILGALLLTHIFYLPLDILVLKVLARFE